MSYFNENTSAPPTRVVVTDISTLHQLLGQKYLEQCPEDEVSPYKSSESDIEIARITAGTASGGRFRFFFDTEDPTSYWETEIGPVGLVTLRFSYLNKWGEFSSVFKVERAKQGDWDGAVNSMMPKMITALLTGDLSFGVDALVGSRSALHAMHRKSLADVETWSETKSSDVGGFRTYVK